MRGGERLPPRGTTAPDAVSELHAVPAKREFLVFWTKSLAALAGEQKRTKCQILKAVSDQRLSGHERS